MSDFLIWILLVLAISWYYNEKSEKRKTIICKIVKIALLIFVFIFTFMGHRPFRKLHASDINTAAIKFVVDYNEKTIPYEPVYQIIEISDYEELCEYLHQIAADYKKKETSYDSPYAVLVIEEKDGTQLTVTIHNQRYINVNGISYRIRSKSYNTLLHYIDALRE